MYLVPYTSKFSARCLRIRIGIAKLGWSRETEPEDKEQYCQQNIESSKSPSNDKCTNEFETNTKTVNIIINVVLMLGTIPILQPFVGILKLRRKCWRKSTQMLFIEARGTTWEKKVSSLGWRLRKSSSTS